MKVHCCLFVIMWIFNGAFCQHPEVILYEGNKYVVAKANTTLKRRCSVQNLPDNLQIETLQWRRRKNSSDFEVTFPVSHDTTLLNKVLVDYDNNSFFYCNAKFTNQYELVSHAIHINIQGDEHNSRLVESTTSTERDTLHDNESVTADRGEQSPRIIIILAIVAAVLCGGAAVIAGLVYMKCYQKTKRSTEPPAEEPEYSYVPIQTMPLYAARALIASNTRLEPEAFVPPLPPPREGTYEYICTRPRQTLST